MRITDSEMMTSINKTKGEIIYEIYINDHNITIDHAIHTYGRLVNSGVIIEQNGGNKNE